MGRMKYQMDLRTMNLVLKWLLIRMLLKKGIIWILFIIFGRGCKCISAMVLRTLFMECWPPRDNWWDNEDGQLDDNEGYSVEEETEYENSV
ncbi:hypothetical protein LINPERHAP1_LOCUS36762 [Linum perenne]